MIKRYLTNDPIANGEYELTKDAAKRLVLTPVNPIDKLLKPTLRSLPMESYNEFISRLNLIPV